MAQQVVAGVVLVALGQVAVAERAVVPLVAQQVLAPLARGLEQGLGRHLGMLVVAAVEPLRQAVATVVVPPGPGALSAKLSNRTRK